MARARLSIGEVADRTGLAVSAVRFYADRGLIEAHRTDGGRRRFDAHVLRRIGFIQVAQRVGLSLDDVAEALADLPSDQAPSAQEWADLASAWRPLLDERIRLLEALRDNLDGCIGCGCLSLDACTLRNPADVVATRGPGPRHLVDPPAVDPPDGDPPDGDPPDGDPPEGDALQGEAPPG